jgi:hypothetical protein
VTSIFIVSGYMAEISACITLAEGSSMKMPLRCVWRIFTSGSENGFCTNTTLETAGSTSCGWNEDGRLNRHKPTLSVLAGSDPPLQKTAAVLGVSATARRSTLAWARATGSNSQMCPGTGYHGTTRPGRRDSRHPNMADAGCIRLLQSESSAAAVCPWEGGMAVATGRAE